MGDTIVALLNLFRAKVADRESAAHIAELAATPARWSAAKDVFREIRDRLLQLHLGNQHAKTTLRGAQYVFEELCCKSLYNATYPKDPFDPSSPFSVAPAAVRLARALGMPDRAVADVLVADK